MTPTLRLIVLSQLFLVMACVKYEDYYCPGGSAENLPVSKDTIFYVSNDGQVVWSVWNKLQVSKPYTFPCRTTKGIISEKCDPACGASASLQGECKLPSGEIVATKIQDGGSQILWANFMGISIHILLPFEQNSPELFTVETNLQLGDTMYDRLLHFQDTIYSKALIREYYYHQQYGFIGFRLEEPGEWFIRSSL